MIPKKTLAIIATLLKIDASALEAAQEATEEVDVAIPDNLKVFNPTELETRDKSLKSGSYTEGKTAGAEMLISELKTDLGLTFDGKDKAAFVSAVKKVPSTEAADVVALRKSITDAEKKAQDAETQLSTYKLRTKVAAKLPAGFNVEMSPDEALTILEANGFVFTEDENGNIKTTRKGVEVKDEKLQTALPVETVLTGFFKDEKKWISDKAPDPAPPSGRGGGSSKVDPAPLKYSEVEKNWVAEGKSTNTAEFTNHVGKIANDNPTFDMNS